MALPELDELRQRIDEVDRKVLDLVAERIRLVLAVGDVKRARDLAVYDPERERALIARLQATATEPLDAETIRRIYERIIDECRRIEQHHVRG